MLCFSSLQVCSFSSYKIIFFITVCWISDGINNRLRDRVLEAEIPLPSVRSHIMTRSSVLTCRWFSLSGHSPVGNPQWSISCCRGRQLSQLSLLGVNSFHESEGTRWLRSHVFLGKSCPTLLPVGASPMGSATGLSSVGPSSHLAP